MAQSEKIFRELLCESRSHPVESTDPNKARTIDELKRQLREAKAELEAERAKARQLQTEHDRDLRRVREEGDKKLSASLEALAIRKEQERATDVRRVEDRLRKEWEAEVRTLEAKKTEELSRAQRRWQHDHEEDVRRAIREERERRLQDLSCESDEVAMKEEKMTRELFQLSQHVSSLEDQVYNLSRENKVQIEQMRRMKHEHELEIADILRQHQTEASRDYAQLRLAEQILAEREQDLHMIENRAERDRLEKEQLVEEMVVMKSTINTSIHEVSESPQTARRSAGGALQKRMDELEATLRKLEEEKGNLKQENASLRKRLVQDSPGDGKMAGKDDEKMRKLRKRNADLVTLVKTLDEKLKSLKSDYDQLQKNSPSESEQTVRKALNRQHAKDIMDYTKQIHGRDKEISELKKRIAKLEVSSKPPSESVPELEKKIKLMALDRLKMEKLVAKLSSQLPDDEEATVLSRTELECEAACVEALDLENQTLKRELAQLQRSKEDVDTPSERSEVTSETERLRTEVARLNEFKSEVVTLRESLDHTESVNSDLEQRCHVLTQQLEISQLAVKELQSNADQVTSLEGVTEQLSREVKASEQRADQLSQECDRVTRELAIKSSQIHTLQDQLDDRDKVLAERELLCQQLQAQISQPHPTEEVGVQTNNLQSYSTPSDKRVNSEPLLVTSDPLSSPRVSALHSDVSTPHVSSATGVTGVTGVGGVRGDMLDSSLELEMKAVGIDVPDPYDSSEGAGFSDLSTHSLESLKSDRVTSDGPPPPEVGVASVISGQLSRTERMKVEDIEEENEADTFHDQPTSAPTLYIAKFSYTPAEQSPNPTFDQELPLTAGDYVYVYGEMDGDGFFQGRLVSGATGLVPSNFVERISEDETPPPRRSMTQRHSILGDIQEVEEESSSSESTSHLVELAPPTNLEVERQFVDGDGTSVALRWTPPTPLSSHVLGYNVYVNGVMSASVTGGSQCSVLLSDVPLTQLVRIIVKSVFKEGESPENAPPIVLNPQYPDPPHNVLVSTLDASASLLVHFSPHPHTRTPVTRYTLYLNQHACTHLETTESTDCQQTISMLVLPRDVLQLESELSSAPSVKLTVTSSNEDYESVPSAPVGVAKDQIAHLLLDEGRVEYSPEQREEDLQLRQTTPMESFNGGHVIQDDSHVTNGVPESTDEGSNKVRYFRALYSYDPHQQSPNKEFAHEELPFMEGDVISSVSEVGVDGFFKGHSHGRSGLVPSNMVEEIVDPEELTQLKNILASHPTINSNGRPQTPPLDNSPRMMRAIHDYDPSLDSPNEHSEVELTFSEGDLIKVLGAPDEDGFYQAELKGKTGLVPKNFLETPTPEDVADINKKKLILTKETDHVLNLRHSD